MEKEIIGREGYTVTEEGIVYSYRSKLKIQHKKTINLTNAGYLVVSFWKNGKGKSLLVHRLVATAFIPNPENKPCVNHIDGNRLNNHVSNLEWCTYSENLKHKFRVLGCAPNKTGTGKFGKLHQNSKPVIQTDLQGNFIAEFEGVMDAYRKTGVYFSNIASTCRGDRNWAGGFYWQYKQLSE